MPRAKSRRRSLPRAAAAALLLAPVWARAVEPACDLEVRAEPPSVGAEAERTVQVLVESGDRAPRLRTSVGALERLRAGAGGRWVADLVLPPVGDPRIAIVSARSGERWGFAAVPIAGRASAKVQARPGESVVVELGTARFGPVRADGAGKATVPVLILPGTRSAWHDGRQVPVEEPPGQHLHLVLSRRGPGPDGEQVIATAFAVAADGAPRAGAAPALSASAGALSAPEPCGPGAWRATWSVPAGEEGRARIAARLPGEPPVELRLAEVPGPPARVEVSTDRDRAQAGDLAPVEVTVRVLDAAGRPADAEELVLEDDLWGSVEAQPAGPGAWRASILVGAALGGRSRMEVRARSGEAAGSAAVALEGGPPAALEGRIALDPPRVAGPATAEVTAAAFDAYGNLTRAEGVTARAARGAVGDPRPAGEGWVAFPYRLEATGQEREEDVVTLRLGELSAELPVRFLAPPPALAVAPRLGVAARGGELGLHAGAEVSTWTRLGGEPVGFGLDAAAWSFGSSGELAAGPGTLAWSGDARSLTLLATASWRRRLGARLLLSASAGAGGAWVESRTALASQRELTEAAWTPAASAAVSLATRAWRGGPFAELRVAWMRDPGLTSLEGDLVPLSLSVGYRIDAR